MINDNWKWNDTIKSDIENILRIYVMNTTAVIYSAQRLTSFRVPRAFFPVFNDVRCSIENLATVERAGNLNGFVKPALVIVPLVGHLKPAFAIAALVIEHGRRVGQLVFIVTFLTSEAHAAILAHERLFVGVNSLVLRQTIWPGKHFVAKPTDVSRDLVHLPLMPIQQFQRR